MNHFNVNLGDRSAGDPHSKSRRSAATCSASSRPADARWRIIRGCCTISTIGAARRRPMSSDSASPTSKDGCIDDAGRAPDAHAVPRGVQGAQRELRPGAPGAAHARRRWRLHPAGRRRSREDPHRLDDHDEGIVNGRDEDGVFKFDPLMHVEGDKVVLGQTIKSGGIEEGEQLLKMLAHHPSTARFISTKLARRFIADDPPRRGRRGPAARSCRRAAISARCVRTILMSPQFRSSEAHAGQDQETVRARRQRAARR